MMISWHSCDWWNDGTRNPSTDIGEEQTRCSVCHRHGCANIYHCSLTEMTYNHRGMKKKLMDLMPETPFEGEPMAVICEPNDMEKSLL